MVPYSQYQSSDHLGNKMPISNDCNTPKQYLSKNIISFNGVPVSKFAVIFE